LCYSRGSGSDLKLAVYEIIPSRYFFFTEPPTLNNRMIQDVSAAAIFISAKPTSHIRAPRSIINVYAYLDSLHTLFPTETQLSQSNDPEKYYISESTYFNRRTLLTNTESSLLSVLGFDTTVVLPHTLVLLYLQTLEVLSSHPQETVSKLSNRAFQLLNSSLHNPQLLYLTHQPPEIACAAVYLAAREAEVKLPDGEWWEVFDCDREKLGFLVVGMMSMEGFVREERQKWEGREPVKKEMVVKLADDELANGG
jgi:hypothetical protein